MLFKNLMVLLLPFETDPFRFYFKIKSDDGGSSFLLILSSQSNTIYWIIPPFPHNLSYTKFSYVVFFFSSWDCYHYSIFPPGIIIMEECKKKKNLVFSF